MYSTDDYDNFTIRNVREEDVPHLKDVLDTLELFPSEMLEEMISEYLYNPETEHLWFTATKDDIPISLGYCAPEELTDKTYNLYAIGVRADLQSQGIGQKMMHYVENQLKKRGNRLLIVETSSLAEFQQTREFYHKLNYVKEAVIRDFWADGDDKVIFCKKIK